jgi:hypothetical protein
MPILKPRKREEKTVANPQSGPCSDELLAAAEELMFLAKE